MVEWWSSLVQSQIIKERGKNEATPPECARILIRYEEFHSDEQMTRMDATSIVRGGKVGRERGRDKGG